MSGEYTKERALHLACEAEAEIGIARAAFDHHYEQSKEAPTLEERALRMQFAELAACRARRHKQWANAYRVLAEELSE